MQLREADFEARALLAGQSDELDSLRQLARERDIAEGRAVGGSESAKGSSSPTAAAADASHALSGSSPAAVDPSAIFQASLSRVDAINGRRVVEALERLKLPNEEAMGARELACWHENKKTIVNSLKTLSSQIYSTSTRILYEILQNADDCSFDEAHMPKLYIECSDAALVAYHNELGFQPRDLYAMCQVGESSKLAGSGKIVRRHS